MKVEIKGDDEEFKEFDKDMKCYRITFWQKEIKSLASLKSENLFFNQKNTCKELVAKISETFKIPTESLRVWQGKKQMKVIKGVLLGTVDEGDQKGNAGKKLRNINLFDKDRVYVEEVKEGEAPKWPDEFEKQSYMITIKFNSPYKATNAFPFSLVVDNRQTILEMKLAILAEFDQGETKINPNEIIMRR